MRSMLEKAKSDWKKHRTRFVIELLALASAIIFSLVFMWNAGSPTVKVNTFLLLMEIFGCGCGLVYGIMRKSVNIFLLNFLMIAFAVVGLLKIYA